MPVHSIGQTPIISNASALISRSTRTISDGFDTDRACLNPRVTGGAACGWKRGCPPRSRRRRIWDSRNLFRAPADRCVIGYADSEQSPVCRQVRQQPGSGEGLDRQRVRSMPRCRPGSGDGDRAPCGLASGTTGGDASRVEAAPPGSRLPGPDTVPRAQGRQPRKGAEECGGAGNCRSIACSVNRFVNRTRRDSTRRGRRSRPSEMDRACKPRSPHPRETARDARETRRMAHNPEVEGSNPSPATKARGPFSNRERAFCMWFVN